MGDHVEVENILKQNRLNNSVCRKEEKVMRYVKNKHSILRFSKASTKCYSVVTRRLLQSKWITKKSKQNYNASLCSFSLPLIYVSSLKSLCLTAEVFCQSDGFPYQNFTIDSGERRTNAFSLFVYLKEIRAWLDFKQILPIKCYQKN